MGVVLLAGSMEDLDAQLKKQRDSMQDVLQLTELPEIDGEENAVEHHMRVHELVACRSNDVNVVLCSPIVRLTARKVLF